MSEETSGHPNAAYFLVKAFVHHWANVINDDPGWCPVVAQVQIHFARQVQIYSTQQVQIHFAQ